MGATAQILRYEGLEGFVTIVEDLVTDSGVADAILTMYSALVDGDIDIAWDYFDEGKSITLMRSPEHYGIFEDISAWMFEQKYY